MFRHLPARTDTDPPLPETARDEGFERIARLAAQFFDVPAALIGLIDGDGARIVARSGSAAGPGAGQVLAHALPLLREDVMVVPDLRGDPRFATLAGVGAAPCWRFHASAAVHAPDGARIGALGLLDVRVRDVCADRIARLADFARLVDSEIAALRSRQSLSRQQGSERAVRQLMDDLPEGVLLLGEDGTIVSCNAVAERMYGAAGQGLVGVATRDLTADDPERLGRLLLAGMLDQVQAVARRIDGSEFPAEYSIKILDAASTLRYALIVRDISARKEEERRAQAAEERRRSYFVTATHELRTPMASVLGFSELLLKHDFEPAESRELLEIVHRQATRLVRLINEMLDLARIESGGREGLDLRAADASAILAATLSGLSGLGARQRIRSRTGRNLPPLTADAGKLQQALTNIVSNALKYSGDDSEIDIEVFATALDARPAIGFRVADRGIGMTADEQARIYEPFYRANGKPDAPGTGLGMTIFKEIIDLHGGLIQIASAPGGGTTVTFVLPAAAPPS